MAVVPWIMIMGVVVVHAVVRMAAVYFGDDYWVSLNKNSLFYGGLLLRRRHAAVGQKSNQNRKRCKP